MKIKKLNSLKVGVGTYGGAITAKALRLMNPERVKRKQLRIFTCPQCGTKSLKKILYGMPGDDFDFDKYIVGGCMPSEADIGCAQCDWSGIWDEI